MAEAQFLPALLNVSGKAGDRVRWTIKVTDDDGLPLDWSGYNFAAQVRVNPNDSGAPVTAITLDVTGAGAGIIVCTVPAATTATMHPAGPSAPFQKSWVWDLQRTKASDATDVRTTHGGAFVLYMDVTR